MSELFTDNKQLFFDQSVMLGL